MTRRVCAEHGRELVDTLHGVECPAGHALESETWDVVDDAGNVTWRVRDGHARPVVELPRGKRLAGRDAEGFRLGSGLADVHGLMGYQCGCRCVRCRAAKRAQRIRLDNSRGAGAP